MCNEMFKELEKAINMELKAKKLNFTIEVKGFDKGFLIEPSRDLEKEPLNEERQRDTMRQQAQHGIK